MIKRLLVLFLVFVILLSSFPNIVLTVMAAPQTHPNTYTNTGDQRADIIGVALTQVGYREGPNNDTKYGEFFNLNYHAWCGLFVSWCAVQAGVPDSVLIKTGIASPQSYGLKQEPAGYIPKPGDLYFTPNYSHVGIVYYVEGDYFYSLEGNTWDGTYEEGVYKRRLLLRNVVFASPNYSGGKECSYIQGVENAHPHKEYYKCHHCGDYYYTGKTITSEQCQTCKELNCSHNFSAFQSAGSNQHIRSCSLCGKKESNNHTWNSGSVIKSATCKESGKKTYRCTACGEEKSETIPKKNDHDFSEWKFKDEKTHTRICAVCAKIESKEHDIKDVWETDGEAHWKECEVCDHLIEKSDHEFGAYCDSPCEICNYVREGGHPFSEEWSVNDDQHWKACNNCESKDMVEDHVYDAACDETCNVCGYSRVTEHSYGVVWETDSESHWYSCGVCGKVKDMEAHNASYVSRKGALQYCTVCNLCLTKEDEHTHGYDEVWQDENYHYGTCSCGLDMPQEVHVWEIKSGICQICSASFPEPAKTENDMIPLYAAGIGVLGLVFAIVLLTFARKKR